MILPLLSAIIPGFVANTYQKPYDTTTMLLVLFGVTVILLLIQWLLRKRK